jgi:hypothetical protein
MQSTTVNLLRLLEAAVAGRVFEVEQAKAPACGDHLRLSERYWLFVGAHDDPTMVSLTDETPESGGQITFWMVRSPDALPEVVRFVLQL